MKVNHHTTHAVLDALVTIQRTIPQLKSAQKKEMGLALNAVWNEIHHEGEGVHGYVDMFSISASGVAKQIADEYGLPFTE